MIVSSVAQTLPSYSKSICGEIVNVLFYMYLIFAGKKTKQKNILVFYYGTYKVLDQNPCRSWQPPQVFHWARLSLHILSINCATTNSKHVLAKVSGHLRVPQYLKDQACQIQEVWAQTEQDLCDTGQLQQLLANFATKLVSRLADFVGPSSSLMILLKGSSLIWRKQSIRCSILPSFFSRQAQRPPAKSVFTAVLSINTESRDSTLSYFFSTEWVMSAKSEPRPSLSGTSLWVRFWPACGPVK